MNQEEQARSFKKLHQPGNPIVLYNIWDAVSANAVAAAGAPALATGSKPLAVSQGYQDGEQIPVERLLETVRQISGNVSVPLSVDFEGGYAGVEEELLFTNIQNLIDAGAVGLNFEDQIVGKTGLYSIDDQIRRINTIRKAAAASGIPLFINARTDLFLKEKDPDKHKDYMLEAKDRGKAFLEAGADGFFVPGLIEPDLITDICETVNLLVNVLKFPHSPSLEVLRNCKVSRVSYGPFAMVDLMKTLTERAATLYRMI